MNLKKLSVLAIACTTLLVGCENPLKSMEEMKNTTGDMKQQTGEMGNTTKKMQEGTEVMYDQLRIGDTRSIRREETKVLKDPTANLADKLESAAVIYKAFEFQLWSGIDSIDNGHKRDELILDAVKEHIKKSSAVYAIGELKNKDKKKYFKSTKELIAKNKISPYNVEVRGHNYPMAFYALAAAMHENNHFQELLHAEKKNFEKLSFYEIMKKAFLKEANGGRKTEYEAELLKEKSMYLDMIQARFDMLVFLGIKKLINPSELNLIQKGKALFGNYKNIPSDFLNLGVDERKDINKKLEGAAKLLRFCQEAGIILTLHKKSHKILEGLDTGDLVTDGTDPLAEELINLIDEITVVDRR